MRGQIKTHAQTHTLFHCLFCIDVATVILARNNKIKNQLRYSVQQY